MRNNFYDEMSLNDGLLAYKEDEYLVSTTLLRLDEYIGIGSHISTFGVSEEFLNYLRNSRGLSALIGDRKFHTATVDSAIIAANESLKEIFASVWKFICSIFSKIRDFIKWLWNKITGKTTDRKSKINHTKELIASCKKMMRSGNADFAADTEIKSNTDKAWEYAEAICGLSKCKRRKVYPHTTFEGLDVKGLHILSDLMLRAAKRYVEGRDYCIELFKILDEIHDINDLSDERCVADMKAELQKIDRKKEYFQEQANLMKQHLARAMSLKKELKVGEIDINDYDNAITGVSSWTSKDEEWKRSWTDIDRHCATLQRNAETIQKEFTSIYDTKTGEIRPATDTELTKCGRLYGQLVRSLQSIIASMAEIQICVSRLLDYTVDQAELACEMYNSMGMMNIFIKRYKELSAVDKKWRDWEKSFDEAVKNGSDDIPPLPK